MAETYRDSAASLGQDQEGCRQTFHSYVSPHLGIMSITKSKDFVLIVSTIGVMYFLSIEGQLEV